MGPGFRQAFAGTTVEFVQLDGANNKQNAEWAKALMPPGPPFVVRIIYEKG